MFFWLPTYCHAHQPGAVVLQHKILIGKSGRVVDGAATGAIAIDEITTLYHEILDLFEGRVSALGDA